MLSIIYQTFLCSPSVTIYDSLGMVRVEQCLYRCPAMCCSDGNWDDMKKTPVYRLDRYRMVPNFTTLHYDDKLMPLPLSKSVVLRRVFLIGLRRIQRWFRRVLIGKTIRLPLAMVYHERLGSASLLSMIPIDLMNLTLAYVL